MITFTICLSILIVGYFVYGRIIEKIFGINTQNVTPAFRLKDGVDFVPMSSFKVFMIQFLNIAGLGPIFGAIVTFGITLLFFNWKKQQKTILSV